MDVGQHELQVFVSLVVILLAALVALICDFLKGNNEQLRELLIEFKVRREEGRKSIPLSVVPAHASMPVEHRIEPPEEPPVVPASPAQVAAKTDWSSVLAKGAEATRSMETNAIPAGGISSGFCDPHFLKRMAESGQRVSGLVVSIGVTRAAGGSIPDTVHDLIQSLLGPNDFACPSSDEEFLLVYPGENGAAAHRRLSQIAEDLWNFQLRSMGTHSILFSWGGVEVRDESIEEAIASANERMQETRRGRKLLMMRPAALRQAV